MLYGFQIDVAPGVVIYDNGCNLHNYCLNRQPNFFKRTWFLVDRFHWPNHVGEIFLELSAGNKWHVYTMYFHYRL